MCLFSPFLQMCHSVRVRPSPSLSPFFIYKTHHTGTQNKYNLDSYNPCSLFFVCVFPVCKYFTTLKHVSTYIYYYYSLNPAYMLLQIM